MGHGWLLAGYALLGRAFAYVGVGPVYVGELSLATGVLAAVLSRSVVRVFAVAATWFLAALMCWGAIRTVPYLGQYGLDALRDATLWGYGLFALVVGAVILARPERLKDLLARYQRFAAIFVVAAPVTYVAFWIAEDPASVFGLDPTRRVKPGDILVHLAGITAFVAVGLGRLSWVGLTCLGATFVLAASVGRGGLVAFVAAVAVLALGGRIGRRVCVTGAGVAAVVVALAVTDVRVGLLRREVSFRQLAVNAASIVVPQADQPNLEDTKLWRLLWWGRIVGYTVTGPYFWEGKGFGINLADDDGFQVTSQTLRSPHNSHLTLLARSGVPGFVLWLLTQGAWAWAIVAAYLRSRARRHDRWASVFLFLLAYWVAMLVNATFDVFFEGPMGGIWFWSLYGVGLAAVRLYRSAPEAVP
jgi:hypothetical protein